MAGNKFLIGLVEQYGAAAVEAAAIASLEYPATMVGTMNEAIQIQSFLENRKA